jgi:hypothetical protein
MRDFITCDIRQISGVLGYVTQSDRGILELEGEEVCSLLQNIKTSPDTHPILCSVGSGHSFLVGEVVGWSGCETDHPPLSIMGVNECTYTSSHPICPLNIHFTLLDNVRAITWGTF